MMTSRAPLRLVAALLCATLTAGCVELIPGRGAPPKLYNLSPKSNYRPDLPTVSWQLVVETPVSAETINTSRIALRRDPLTLDFYGNALWSERAPVLVQTLLVESFENTGKIVAVARKATDLRADYVLKMDLREFQAEYDGAGPPQAHVRLNAKLVKMPQRTIIAAHMAQQRVRAEGSDMNQVIYAFDGALGGTLKSVVEWALRAAE